MRKNMLLIGFVVGLLLLGSAFAASSKNQSKMSGSLQMSGKIVSSNNSELVLSSKKNGKSENETFVVNSETKTKGTLTTGESATVHYKNENGQKVATMISAHKASSPSKTK